MFLLPIGDIRVVVALGAGQIATEKKTGNCVSILIRFAVEVDAEVGPSVDGDVALGRDQVCRNATPGTVFCHRLAAVLIKGGQVGSLALHFP